MATLIISKKTKKGQDLEVTLDGRKIIVTLDGVTIPNKQNGITDVDYKGRNGLGKMTVVAGTTLLTREEGQRVGKALNKAVKQDRDEHLAALQAQHQAQREEPTDPDHDLDEALSGVPKGTSEIEAAQAEYSKATAKYERAQEREEIASYPSAKNLDALLAKYPRAALYLKCKSYELASHDLKATAGAKAAQLILDGGKVEDVGNILSNWLPASAMWD
jgi:hypothetical protein